MNYQMDYFYGHEANQFTFFRIPKLLFSDERFIGLTSDAKILYGLMLDRMGLSVKNGWIDEKNHVYIYFTLEEAMEYMRIGKDKGVKLFAELDDEKGCGLIKKKKQGLGKPTLIYVMNFVSNIECPEDGDFDPSNNDKAEVSESTEVKTSINTEVKTSGNAEVKTSEKPKSGLLEMPNTALLEMPNTALLENRSPNFVKTEVNNNDFNNNKNNNTDFSDNYDAIKFASFNSKEKIAKFKNDVTATANELGLVKREIQNEVGRLDRLKLKREKLFQKLMDNQMSDDEYMKLSDEVEREQIAVEDKIRDLKKKQKTVLAKKKEKETTVKTYKEIGAIKKIDRNVVDKFIKKMIVSKEGRVELEWNFKNIFVC